MTRHTWRPGGATYYPMDGARQRDPLEPDDVIAALDAMAQEIENLRAELDGRAPVAPTDHWSPWLEWRGGPCPMPADAAWEFQNANEPHGSWYGGNGNFPRVWHTKGRFRYRSPDPAGWLPRGDWIPPAELWDEGCPVRCEWINATVDSSAVQREQMTPGTWSFATHIRLVARQPQAELPEFTQDEAVIWDVIKGWDISRDGRSYAGATGNDAREIAKAVRAAR